MDSGGPRGFSERGVCGMNVVRLREKFRVTQSFTHIKNTNAVFFPIYRALRQTGPASFVAIGVC